MMISSLIGIMVFGAVAVIALAVFAFWVWMLVDALTNKGLTETEKIVFVLVIVFTHAIGGLIYFFVGRPKRTISPAKTV